MVKPFVQWEMFFLADKHIQNLDTEAKSKIQHLKSKIQNWKQEL
jgi:hypothetical protein